MAQQSIRKSISTYASVTTRGHSTATNVTPRFSATNATDYVGKKENLNSQNPGRQSHGTKAYVRARVQDSIEESENDGDEHEADGDYTPADDSRHDHGSDDDEDADEEEDEASPVRGRTRRMSEKQAQIFKEQRQAEERKHEKALKAAKATKKKAGVIEPDTRGPIQDDSLRNINGGVIPDRVFLQTGFASTPVSEPSRELPHRRENRPHNSLQSVSAPPCQPRHTSCYPRSDSPRSHSPDAGDKRQRSTSADSDDLRPTQTTKTTSSGRPRAKDLDDQAKEYTVCTIDRYRCFISAKQFFTDHTTEPGLVHRAWDETCEELGGRLPLTPVIYKLIASRGPQCRSELKTKLRPLTEIMYGFKSGHNKKDISFNRTHAENLKEEASFAFKDPESKTGLFKHPILQKACNAMWFANRRDEGPSHPEIFNPLPEEALAALLTVTENTIDEYLTGIRTDVPFTANEYRSVYDTHLWSLREFREDTTKYNLLDKILTRMRNVGCFHSGARPITTAPTSVLSKDVLDAALKEWEEDLETETKGSDGEHSE
ncbi:hypothetical protein B0H14DRAFT_3710162 [Mycena olivaceomarginata]|nr:hypothetical protein B0H14DRAFT_3710162 [Mycena olivaceomarginata]